MVLLDDVVAILDLVHHDRHVAAGVDRIDGCLAGAALVHRDLVGFAVCYRGLVKEALRRSHVAPGREQKGYSISLPVDGAIAIFSGALDLDVGLIHAPTSADRALVFAGHFSMRGKKRIAYRLIDEWSTDTPRSSIISSRCR